VVAIEQPEDQPAGEGGRRAAQTKREDLGVEAAGDAGRWLGEIQRGLTE